MKILRKFEEPFDINELEKVYSMLEETRKSIIGITQISRDNKFNEMR